MKKKILALILSVVMVIGILPVYAFAEDDSFVSSDGLWQYVSSSANGGIENIIITAYLGDSDSIVVPAFVDGKFVTGIYQQVIANYTVKTAVISQGIQNISCIMPTSVFFLKTKNTNYALETLIIPESVSYFGPCLFSYLDNLKEISVSKFNNCFSSEDGVLYNKDKTVLIDYPSKKADEEFTVPSSVTEINDYAFVKCYNLKRISVGDNVTYLGAYFLYSCPLLEEVKLGEGIDEVFAYSFYNCDSLETLAIPDSVTSWVNEGVGSECDLLKSVSIGSGCSQIRSNSFNKCNSLEKVIIKNPKTFVGESTWYKKAAFSGCPNTTTFYSYFGSKAESFTNTYKFEFRAIGDADGDGIMDVNDIGAVMSASIGMLDIDENQSVVFDYNHDGVIDAFDVAAIDRAMAE